MDGTYSVTVECYVLSNEIEPLLTHEEHTWSQVIPLLLVTRQLLLIVGVLICETSSSLSHVRQLLTSHHHRRCSHQLSPDWYVQEKKKRFPGRFKVTKDRNKRFSGSTPDPRDRWSERTSRRHVVLVTLRADPEVTTRSVLRLTSDPRVSDSRRSCLWRQFSLNRLWNIMCFV